MPSVTSVFLVLALVLAVVIGPQTRAWTWGPAMLALGLAVISALPTIWKKASLDLGLVILGSLVVGWFGWRAWNSPVAELGQADLLLLAGAVGASISIRAILGHSIAERILIWGITLLLLANILVVLKQLPDDSFTPLFKSRAALLPSGFFAHYNEAANFLIATSFIVAAAAFLGQERMPIRILWGTVAIAGLAAIYFTRSRGGIFGGAVGLMVFTGAALVVGKQRGSKWFAPALIALPILGLAAGLFLYIGWQDAQSARSQGTVAELFDNNIRLYLLGIAASCIATHSMLGGGSRSFSWESFQHWDAKAYGYGGARPEFVHNEMMQAATDYGLIGLGLVLVLFIAIIITGLTRTLLAEGPERNRTADAWRAGGIAGLAGMMIQSSFSFVFHLMPGVLMLGMCLALISLRQTGTRQARASSVASKVILSILALACLFPLFVKGYAGTLVTHALWPTFFDKDGTTDRIVQTDALGKAIEVWPQASLYKQRALLFQEMLVDDHAELPPAQAATNAMASYTEAALLHPYDPGVAINRANLLSFQMLDDEAERQFEEAIRLQGSFEPAFNSHLSLAKHLLSKGARQLHSGDSSKATDTLRDAKEHIEVAAESIPPWQFAGIGRQARAAIYETLGVTLESAGDLEAALASYNFASDLPSGTHIHYRAGAVLGKLAAGTWATDPSSALSQLNEAKRRIRLSKELPAGVTPSLREEYMAHLDQSIRFLKLFEKEPASSRQK